MDKPESDTVVIKLWREPWHLEVGGRVESYEIYRLILLEALRIVEQKIRLQDMAQYAQGQQEAARVAALLGRARNGGG